MAKAGERFPEIDMLKGFACVAMLVGHTMRARMPEPALFGKLVMHVCDVWAAPMFFFASGMNVVTFLDNNRRKPGFAYVKFYLYSAALLFLLGFTYNLNRGSLMMMDVFQCVGLGTAIVFLLMRTRLPDWAHWLIVAAIFLIPMFGFRLPLETADRYAGFRAARDAVPWSSDLVNPGLSNALREILHNTRPLVRWLTLQFGPLPWAGFFYVGALCYRSVAVRRAKTKPWWIFFGALTGLSLVAGFGPFGRGLSGIDAVMMHTFLDMMLRAYPHYMMVSVGSCGLLYLLSRRYYRGAASYAHAAARWTAGWLERLGKESFLFLIMHWWLISTTLLFSHLRPRAVQWGLPAFDLLPVGRVALVMAGVLLLLGPVARLRDWLTLRRRFKGLMYGAMAASFLGAAMVQGATHKMEAGLYVTYGAGFAFAFVYPKLRADLRKRYTKAPPPAAA